MSDLFGNPLISGSLPKDFRRLPEIAPRKSQGTIVDFRTSGAGSLRKDFRRLPGSAGKSTKSLSPGDRTSGMFGLPEQRSSLENEIEKLEAELASANSKQAPYKAAFDHAHLELLSLHRARLDGGNISKPTILAAYDKRMVAGHAWHPFRLKAKELTVTLKAYRDELRAVNKEIGI